MRRIAYHDANRAAKWPVCRKHLFGFLDRLSWFKLGRAGAGILPIRAEGGQLKTMITKGDLLKKQEETLTFIAFVWFCRLIAVLCFYSGITYWIRLIGYHDGPLYRFDLMPVHWQVAATSLAVLFPVAASGLWMVVSWGPVIWVAAAAAEAVMYLWFPELFGARPVTLVAHGAVAVLYLVFRLALYRETRLAAR